ncbi:p3 [Penicillium italicum chrysovirus]|nr:p3 [Penicillium italicum chrysovirus]
MGFISNAILGKVTGLGTRQIERLREQGRAEPARHRRKLHDSELMPGNGSTSGKNGSRKDRMSSEDKTRHKKLKHRSKQPGDKPTLPQPETDMVFGGLDKCPLYGVVMPMGHGKTTLAQEEGWIDCDSLITPSTKRRLAADALRKLADGEEYENAMAEMSSVMAKALQVLTPSKPAILLSHSVNLLKICQIPCLAILSLEDGVFEKNLRLRDEAEQCAARISKRHLEAAEGPGRPVITVQDNDYMRTVIYQIAESMDVELGAPRLLHPECSLPPGVGGTEWCDLTELVRLYERGALPRAVLDYQINAQGLKAYRGYGFTMNDWAATAAHLVDNTCAADGAIPSLDNWPLTLEGIGKTFDMSEDIDGQALLAAHGGEDEAFTLGLLLHWKMYGLKSDTTGRLRLLYYVRRNRWDLVMRKVRQGVLGSGTFMGEPITLAERDILLSLHMLSSTSVSALVAKWRDEKMGYPSSRPSKRLMCHFDDILPHLVVQVPGSDPSYERTAWDVFLSGNLKPLRECAAGLLGECKLKRKHVISYLLGVRLLNEWEDEQGAHRVAREAMKQVATNWFRVGKIRDEWFDLIGAVLDGECRADDPIAQMAVMMTKTGSCQNLSGMPWGVRVAEAVQRIVMVGWCGLQMDQKVVLQQTENGVLPIVLGNREEEYIIELMKLGAPKYMTSVTGSEESVLATMAELADWSRSGVGLVLELVNAGSWLGQMSPKDRIALLANWATRRETTGVDSALFGEILDRFSRQWLKRKFTPRAAEHLRNLGRISRRDGGLGIAERVYRGTVVPGKDGKSWNGKDAPRLKKESVERVPKINLVACRNVLTSPKMGFKWNAHSLGMCGALVSCFLMGGEKHDIEGMCATVEGIKKHRVHPLASLPDWEQSYSEGAELDEAIEVGINDCMMMLEQARV